MDSIAGTMSTVNGFTDALGRIVRFATLPRFIERVAEEAGTHLAWTAVHFDRDGASKARQAMDLDKGWIP